MTGSFGCLSVSVWPHDCVAHTAWVWLASDRCGVAVSSDYNATVAENTVVNWEVDGMQFDVDFWNVSGHNFKNQYTCRML